MTLRFALLKDRPIRQPQLLTAPGWAPAPGPYFGTTGHDPDLRGAAREAPRGMLDRLGREYGLTAPQAYIPMSVCANSWTPRTGPSRPSYR